MPARVSFNDDNWTSKLASVIPRSTHYTLEWKENEIIVHFEYDGQDPDPSYPDPYEEEFGDGASL